MFFAVLYYFIIFHNLKEGEGNMSILLKRILHLSSENVSCCSDTAVQVSPAGWTLCYKGKETLPLYHSVWPGETTACRVEGKHQQRYVIIYS